MTRKVGQTDLVLVYDQGLLEGLCMQDYRSVCSRYDLCHPIHPDTHRQHSEQLIWIAQPAELKFM